MNPKVYYNAAKLIAEGKSKHCFYAIVISGCKYYKYWFPITENYMYHSLFKEYRTLTFNKRNQLARSLALLFMYEITKAENKRR